RKQFVIQTFFLCKPIAYVCVCLTKSRVMYRIKIKLKGGTKEYESAKSNPTGRELLQELGLAPAEDYELFMKIAHREFEPIQPDEVVDLTKPGIEFFQLRRRLEITYEFDDEVVSSYECFVTPAQLLLENGYDPEKFYLKKIEGRKEINYKRDKDAPLSLRNGDKFISFKEAATPVA
ncbi:MAG: multiubiquitin domain-containing protein, partial [Bacteroidota bacterium]